VFEIAFVTCARLPELDADDRLAVAPLAELGVKVTPAVWDDDTVDWDRFDLAVIRSTWDYTDRRDQFVAWARSVPRLVNPAEIVAWNTDKRYLDDLADSGIPVVSTSWITHDDPIDLPHAGEYVIKPSVGAGSMDAQRYDLADTDARATATAHVERLIASGKTVMLQPFAHAIETAGETGVILVAGKVSHAITKGVMLGPTSLDDVDELYKEERIEGRNPSPAEVELAHAAVRAIPVDRSGLLYARVDMVPGPDDRPMLMELELTEPSLFMVTAPGSEVLFAQAIAERVRQTAESRK
jgi:hypothetical protein